MTTLSNEFNNPNAPLDNNDWWRLKWVGGEGQFLNGFSPDRVSVNKNGEMTITMSPDAQGKYTSGQYASVQRYQHGRYEAEFQASDAPGVVTGFFTYTGPDDGGTPHDEIDFEILGDNPRKLQVNYYTNNVQHPKPIDLGFDASKGMHTYAFEWTNKEISWYVDGKLVHQENGSRGPLPTLPGKVMLNLWATSGLSPWSSDDYDGRPTEVKFNYVKYSSDLNAAPSSFQKPLLENNPSNIIKDDQVNMLFNENSHSEHIEKARAYMEEAPTNVVLKYPELSGALDSRMAAQNETAFLSQTDQQRVMQHIDGQMVKNILAGNFLPSPQIATVQTNAPELQHTTERFA